jgi:hypothetical protein
MDALLDPQLRHLAKILPINHHSKRNSDYQKIITAQRYSEKSKPCIIA